MGLSHLYLSLHSYTVARRHVNVVGSLSVSKSDFSNRKGVNSSSHDAPVLPRCCSASHTNTCPAGFEAAHLFLKTREVPDVWKMDLSQILDSSSSDDDDEEDEEKESEEEEEEEDDENEK